MTNVETEKKAKIQAPEPAPASSASNENSFRVREGVFSITAPRLLNERTAFTVDAAPIVVSSQPAAVTVKDVSHLLPLQVES